MKEQSPDFEKAKPPHGGDVVPAGELDVSVGKKNLEIISKLLLKSQSPDFENIGNEFFLEGVVLPAEGVASAREYDAFDRKVRNCEKLFLKN